MTQDRRKTISPEIIEVITTSIETSIKENVNGKIDKMSHKMDEYIEGDLKWKEVVDTKLKDLEPVSVGLKTASGLRRFIIYIGGFGIGGAVVYYLKDLFR